MLKRTCQVILQPLFGFERQPPTPEIHFYDGGLQSLPLPHFTASNSNLVHALAATPTGQQHRFVHKVMLSLPEVTQRLDPRQAISSAATPFVKNLSNFLASQVLLCKCKSKNLASLMGRLKCPRPETLVRLDSGMMAGSTARSSTSAYDCTWSTPALSEPLLLDTTKVCSWGSCEGNLHEPVASKVKLVLQR